MRRVDRGDFPRRDAARLNVVRRAGHAVPVLADQPQRALDRADDRGAARGRAGDEYHHLRPRGPAGGKRTRRIDGVGQETGA